MIKVIDNVFDEKDVDVLYAEWQRQYELDLQG